VYKNVLACLVVAELQKFLLIEGMFMLSFHFTRQREVATSRNKLFNFTGDFNDHSSLTRGGESLL
jgi:hypothetical protein